MIRRSVIAAVMAGSAILAGIGAPAALAAGKPAHAVPPAAGAAHAAAVAHAAGAAHARMSPAQLATAAASCASWAADAGFADNGYLNGSLTTAVAVALAESGCATTACWDNTRGRTCTQSTENASDSVNRGAWQLNNVSWPGMSDSCAYRGQCSADYAYTAASLYGTNFASWPRYQSDSYARYLWPAQQAVNALRQGTITSALIGSCVAYPSDRLGALVELANCGTGAADQIWTIRGNTLRTSGGLCLSTTATHRSAPLALHTCDLSTLQEWLGRSGFTLYNPGAGLCMNDPDSLITPGLVLDDSTCALAQNQAWFRP